MSYLIQERISSVTHIVGEDNHVNIIRNIQKQPPQRVLPGTRWMN
jgi:hypothetical protein